MRPRRTADEEEREQGRRRVRRATQAAVRRGEIKLGDKCVDCGGPGTEAHHVGEYNRDDVVLLCSGCHAVRHGREPNGPTETEYRSRWAGSHGRGCECDQCRNYESGVVVPRNTSSERCPSLSA